MEIIRPMVIFSLFLLVSVPLAVMDSKYFRTSPWVLLLGILGALIFHGFTQPDLLQGHLFAGLLGFLVFSVIAYSFPNRLGGGDGLFAAFLGSLLGMEGLWTSVALACILGLTAYGLFFLYRYKISAIGLPFITLMGLGGFIYLWAKNILNFSLASLLFFFP